LNWPGSRRGFWLPHRSSYKFAHKARPIMVDSVSTQSRKDAELHRRLIERRGSESGPFENPCLAGLLSQSHTAGSIEQQSLLCVHRLREGFKAERTACINRICGLLAEFGLMFPQKPEALRLALPDVLEDGSNELGGIARMELHRAQVQWAELDAHLACCDERIAAHLKADEQAASGPAAHGRRAGGCICRGHRGRLPAVSQRPAVRCLARAGAPPELQRGG
jgi:hypothetical protein